jgi:hypothetical protein
MTVTKLPTTDTWTIRIGADFSAEYLWTADGSPKNMTNWTARCQARSTDTDAVLFNITTADHITLSNAGLITVTLPHAMTTAFAAGRYVADLDITSAAGMVIPFLRLSIMTGHGVIHD